MKLKCGQGVDFSGFLGERKPEVPIALMNYHIDDLNIPVHHFVDPYQFPEREVAYRLLMAYFDSVH